MIILSIKNGNLIANDRIANRRTTLATKELTEADLRRSVRFFKEVDKESIYRSSSVNWPEDDGGPEYSLLDAFLQKAIHS